MATLDSLLEEASGFVQEEFGVVVEKSKLRLYSSENWQRFCKANNFVFESEGVYVPANHTAYVRVDTPYLVSNAYHELFGHGLFCEHSQLGKRLVEIISSQGDEQGFLQGVVDPLEQPLGLCERNIHNYEGFAMWLEALLCEETSNARVWHEKKDGLPFEFVELYEYFKGAEERLTRFGFLSQLGFPKTYDEERVLGVVRKLYGSAFENVDFVVLYGSQKPYSDIDLFVVSSNPSHNYTNGWLDIYELHNEEFSELSRLFDISVTDPLFTGKLIYGDRNAFEQIKTGIYEQPISVDAINHNFAQSQTQKSILDKLSTIDHRRNVCSSYVQTYQMNAEQLAQGTKYFTRKSLQNE